MYNARAKRLPVVSENGHLAGIISRADVLSVYGRPDEEIAQETTKNVILNEFLSDPDLQAWLAEQLAQHRAESPGGNDGGG